jgi:alcohol dehydrogenase
LEKQTAHIAGKVINISKTTAPHAFSYAFTTGLCVSWACCSATLTKIFQTRAIAEKSLAFNCGVKLSSAMSQMRETLAINSSEGTGDQLMSFTRSLGVNPSFESIGAGRAETWSDLSKKANLERLISNPNC